MANPHVRIIAEAGVNHNGDIGLALELVAAAARAGADDVKFQTFDADALASGAAPLADYQRAAGVQAASQQSMLLALQLNRRAHDRLLEACGRCGIGFLSSAFDHASLELLAGELGLGTIKFGSGELTNGPLLLDAAMRKRRIILSTGMADLGEIEEALGVIAFGLMASPGAGYDPTQKLDTSAFRSAWRSTAGRDLLKRHVLLLHCVSDYPAADDELNLRATKTLGAAFGLPVGFSDHSMGSRACLAAVARGAVCIEKHLTLDRTMPGPDHAASLEPAEMSAMISDIRAIGRMLGTGLKIPTDAELRTAQVARKTIVAIRDIAAGEPFDAGNIAIRRSGVGLPPNAYWSLLDRPSPKAFHADEIIEI